jgi:hypothetical protein
MKTLEPVPKINLYYYSSFLSAINNVGTYIKIHLHLFFYFSIISNSNSFYFSIKQSGMFPAWSSGERAGAPKL